MSRESPREHDNDDRSGEPGALGSSGDEGDAPARPLHDVSYVPDCSARMMHPGLTRRGGGVAAAC
jgi:hypothetical protein